MGKGSKLFPFFRRLCLSLGSPPRKENFFVFPTVVFPATCPHFCVREGRGKLEETEPGNFSSCFSPSVCLLARYELGTAGGPSILRLFAEIVKEKLCFISHIQLTAKQQHSVP